MQPRNKVGSREELIESMVNDGGGGGVGDSGGMGTETEGERKVKGSFFF